MNLSFAYLEHCIPSQTAKKPAVEFYSIVVFSTQIYITIQVEIHSLNKNITKMLYNIELSFLKGSGEEGRKCFI